MVKFNFYIFCLILVISNAVYSQNSISEIDKIVNHHIENQYFEGTVLIAEKGKVIYHKSVGFADRGNRMKITNETKFSIASITKLFTAIIILQLEEEGKLKTEDPINQFLPELKIPNGNKITIHHLLLHISGLPNEKDIIYNSKKTPKEFTKVTIKNKINEIGSFNYANIDYVLLGLITEKLTGKKWEVVLAERFFKKLKMQNTGFLIKGHYPENFAYTYQVTSKGKFKKDPLFHIENYYAAGNMFSTLADLLILDQALYGETLLKESTKNKMFKSYPEYNYSGYSVWTYKYPFAETTPQVMERRGGILGANSVILRIIDQNKTIIILSNNNKFNPDSFGDKNNLREALLIELGKKKFENK